MTYTIAALYKFFDFYDYQSWRPKLLTFMKRRGICGSLLLAREGINGTIAGPQDAMEAFKTMVLKDTRFLNWSYKESHAMTSPFLRTKVRLKKEIVSLGDERVDPTKKVGTYVAPEDWNDLIADENTLVLDCRNRYETAIGTFKGAIDPGTETFRAFPEVVKQNAWDKKRPIAMFCTGGIRCEKASAHLLNQGYEKVYHLKGGILDYFKHVKPEESLWEGECFVFDDRVTVGHDLNPGAYELCHGCRFPLSDQDKKSSYFQEGVSCPRCYDTRTQKQKNRAAERQKQMDLARARGVKHLGPKG